MGKFLTLLIVFALVSPFVIPGPDGTPVFSLSDIKPEVELALPEIPVADAQASRETQVYRYQTPDGAWVYTDQADAHPNAEPVVLDTRTNNLTFAQPSSERWREGGQGAVSAQSLSEVNPVELLERAQAVDGMLQSRDQALRDSVEQLR